MVSETNDFKRSAIIVVVAIMLVTACILVTKIYSDKKEHDAILARTSPINEHVRIESTRLTVNGECVDIFLFYTTGMDGWFQQSPFKIQATPCPKTE